MTTAPCFAAYVPALEAVLDAGVAAIRDQLGITLPRPALELVLAHEGAEGGWNDGRVRIVVALAGPERLAPPPAGFRVVYGVAHELGHLAVARLLPPSVVLPVLWDEAFAHVLAVELILPCLRERQPVLPWPEPYPDWFEREAVDCLAPGPAGYLGSYEASLRAAAGSVRRVLERDGWRGIARVIAQCRSADPVATRRTVESAASAAC